jgi:hypothetical protein
MYTHAGGSSQQSAISSSDEHSAVSLGEGGVVDESGVRAERLLTLSAVARRLADMVAAAEEPLRFEVLRHALRVPEGDAIAALREATNAGLVRRADADSYVPSDEATAAAIREGRGDEWLARIRALIAGATARVYDA